MTNLIGGGIFRNNIISFPGDDERLEFTKGAEKGTYRPIRNMRFRLVSTIYKDSNKLQFISSLRKTVIIEESRRIFWDI